MPTLFKTDDDTTLSPSPALLRLHRNFHDLIIITCEAYMKVPSKCLSLIRLSYVFDEKLEEKYCMHFDALVRELGQKDAIPLHLSIIASTEK